MVKKIKVKRKSKISFKGLVTSQKMKAAARMFKNWGRWGKKDEIGTLNFTSPKDIVGAAKLVESGKVMSWALNFDQSGPQGGKTK